MHSIIASQPANGASNRQPDGIFGAANRLQLEIGVHVMRDFEAEKLVALLIERRDRMRISFAARQGRQIAASRTKELESAPSPCDSVDVITSSGASLTKYGT